MIKEAQYTRIGSKETQYTYEITMGTQQKMLPPFINDNIPQYKLNPHQMRRSNVDG